MIESSLFLRNMFRMIVTLKAIYNESFFSRVINGVSNCFVNFILGSCILGFFTESKGYQLLANSYFHQRLSNVEQRYNRGVGMTVKEWINGSQILRLYGFIDGFYLAVVILVGTMIFLPTKYSMVLAAMVLVFYVYDSFRGVHARYKGSLVGVLIGMFVLLMIESLMTAINFSNSIMIAAIYIIFILTTLAIGAGVLTKKKLMILLNVLMGVLMVSCLYAFYQFVVGVEMDPAWVDEEMFGDITRIYSVFGNPNVYGVYLVMMVPLAAALLISAKGFIQKFIYLCATGAGLICILLTSSRGSMLSVVLALGIMLLFMDKRFIFVGLAGLAAMPFVLPASIMARLMSIGNMQESSSAYRISIYRACADIIRDFFVGGLGLGGFNEVYFAYAYEASRAFHAHNTFLMVLIELGIVGFLIFIAILVFWVKTLMSAFFKSENQTYRMIILACVGGIAGASLQGLVEHIWFNSDVMFFYWLLIIIGLIVSKLAKNEEVIVR